MSFVSRSASASAAIRRTLCIALAAGVAAGLLVAPSITQAADALEQIRSSGKFRIATEGTYAPFSFHDVSGGLTGFDVEVGNEIAKRMGVKTEWVEGKWDGLIAGLDVNRSDAVMNQVTITPERMAKYDFSQSYLNTYAALIVREDSPLKSFADLKGKKSANTLTSMYGRLAAESGAEVIATQGFNESMDLLTSGRVDATINDQISFLDYRKKRPSAKVKVAALSDKAQVQGVLIRKGNPELLAAIDKAIADMKQDGTYQKLGEKYFGAEFKQ